MPTYEEVEPDALWFEGPDPLLPRLISLLFPSEENSLWMLRIFLFLFTLELEFELEALRRSRIFFVLFSSDVNLLSSTELPRLLRRDVRLMLPAGAGCRGVILAECELKFWKL